MHAIRLQRKHIVGLVVVAVLLFATQAWVYRNALRKDHNETQKQDTMGQHRPSEAPGLAGLALLLGAAGLLIYKRPYTPRPAEDESMR